MNAAAFNTEHAKLMNRALREGCFTGKMSPAELLGIVELGKQQAAAAILTPAQAATAKPIILTPPPGLKLPGAN